MICTQIRKDETGGTCSMYGKRGEGHIGFCREDLKKIYHFEDLAIDGRIILKRIFKK